VWVTNIVHGDNHERREEDTHVPRKHASDRKSNAKRDVGNSEGDHVHAGLGHHISVFSDLRAASA
jgi:hypothetical protein